MKGWEAKCIVFCLALCLCLPYAVQAASIGGGKTQGKGTFSFGLEQELAFDWDAKSLTETEVDGTYSDTEVIKIELDKMYRTMLKASYGLLDTLDIFIKLGMVDADYEGKVTGTWADTGNAPPRDKGTFSGSAKLKGESAFGYGFGMKGANNLGDNWFVGGNIQYMRHENDYTTTGTFTKYNANGAVIDTGADTWKGEITFYEWHVAPYIGMNLGSFMPYLGARYSDVRVKDKDIEDGETTTYKSDDNFGMFLGGDYMVNENFSLNLEGRFMDETAVSLAAVFKF
ncbi:porin family protein [bacterium]|nr:porin family protein [bacterium]